MSLDVFWLIREMNIDEGEIDENRKRNTEEHMG
jgi:hypothetical protein